MWFKKEHQALTERNASLVSENEVLKARIRELESEQVMLQEQLQQCRMGAEVTSAITQYQLQGAQMLNRIRDDILDVSQNLTEEETTISNLTAIFDQTQAAVVSLQQRAEVIRKQASDSMGAVNDLSRTANNINHLVSSIQEISDQTNLLALNAAIEAARAGEAGRGFAVVADEVRQLASKAHKASSEIEALVSDVLRQTTSIAAMVESNQDSAGLVKDSSEDIGSVSHQVLDHARHMQRIIRYATQATFLNTVKLDHSVWKNQVYQLIEDRSLDSVVNSHTECRLGKWYFEGDGKERYSHLSSFSRLDSPHRLVHESGKKALEALKSGKIDQLSVNLAQMERSSEEVVSQINHLLKDSGP